MLHEVPWNRTSPPSFQLLFFLVSPTKLSTYSCWLNGERRSVNIERWQKTTQVSGNKNLLSHPKLTNVFFYKIMPSSFWYIWATVFPTLIQTKRYTNEIIILAVGKSVNCFHLITNHVKLQTFIFKRIDIIISAVSFTHNHKRFAVKHYKF
jgi:hypothetical protein